MNEERFNPLSKETPAERVFERLKIIESQPVGSRLWDKDGRDWTFDGTSWKHGDFIVSSEELIEFWPLNLWPTEPERVYPSVNPLSEQNDEVPAEPLMTEDKAKKLLL